jgi:ArsR family transcriptional regulator
VNVRRNEMKRKEKFKKAAEILKAIAHPTRLMILDTLCDKTECVREFEKEIKKRQANISQHLAILRSAGLIDYLQEGKKRCYYLKKPKEVRKILDCFKRIT